MNSTISFNGFDCHMYVPADGAFNFILPPEPGPMKVARFEPLDHDELIDPGFRRLLAAFESVPEPLIVQV